ncbi:MAG: response regulator [Marinifilaceae bacterium]
MQKQLKIYIVDDHALFREGLRFLLSNCDFVSTIDEASTGNELLQDIDKVNPDIVLMDIEMPGINGTDTTREAIKRKPGLKIIALSMYGDENFYTEMMDAGARGFLLKNSRFEDVQQAILEVSAGRNYFSAEILASIVRNLNRKPIAHTSKVLSKREVEVLYNICRGLSNQEIGQKLHISKRTVDKHRENILMKTQSKNTAELVVYAVKNKYFEV